MQGKKLAALLLIALGTLVILGKLGIGLGFIIGLLIPVLVILLGIAAWHNGNRTLGGIIVVIGGFMLLGKLSGLLVWVAAIAAVLVGISWLTRSSAPRW